MIRSTLRLLTDIIYVELFGKNTLGLLLHLKLSPSAMLDEEDNDLRDEMGELALQALGEIEGACAIEIEQYNKRNIAWDMLVELVGIHATQTGNEYKAIAAGLGVDLLTGERLEQNERE